MQTNSVHMLPNPSKTNLFGRLVARPRNLFWGVSLFYLRPFSPIFHSGDHVLFPDTPFRRWFLFFLCLFYTFKSTCRVRVMMNAKDWEATNEYPLVGAIHHPRPWSSTSAHDLRLYRNLSNNFSLFTYSHVKNFKTHQLSLFSVSSLTTKYATFASHISVTYPQRSKFVICF